MRKFGLKVQSNQNNVGKNATVSYNEKGKKDSASSNDWKKACD